MKKLIGISKRMKDALEAEGLTLNEERGEDGLYYEGTFCTGIDWEKSCVIDLRGKRPRCVSDADDIAVSELQGVYDAFDIDEEMKMYLDAGLRGTPDPERLLEDMKEQEAKLKRFAEVAYAVANHAPIPADPNENPLDTFADGKETYYIIESGNGYRCYWRTLDGYHNGAIDTAWGDPSTADRFDTADEARRHIRRNPDNGAAYVRRIVESKSVRIYDAA